MKSVIVLGVICSLLASVSQVLLKISIKHLEFFPSITYYLNNLYFFMFFLSLLFYLIGLILWLIVLKNLELSKSVAFMILSFILVFSFSILILKEPLTIKKLVGIVLSLVGIIILIY